MPADGDMAVADLEFRQGQPPEVDLIQVSRQSPGKFGRWSAGPEFLPTDQNISGIVQDRISAKAGRLQTYGGCDEYWLLLVADSFRASGKLALAEAVKLNTFSSPFKRTYISDFGRGHLYQLNDDDGLFTMKP
jgi:hypothetical protein